MKDGPLCQPQHRADANLVEEWTAGATPNLARSFVIGHSILSQWTDQTSQVLFLLADGHGSTQMVIDSAGAIQQSYDYDAYGNLINPPASPLTSHLYTGEQFDTRTGQYYLRARYYDSATHRFNRLDPYAGSSENPLTLHKYLYCHGNPIDGIDPTGLFEFSLTGMLVSTCISSILGAILSPVIKPAAAYVADIFGGTLIGGFVDQWLSAMAGAPPALMLGADFMGGLGYSTCSVTGGLSLELLLSPDFTAGYVAANASFSLGGSGSYLRGSIAGKGGVVFGAENATDYEGRFRSITLPLKSMPQKLRDKLVEWSGNFVGLAASGLTGLNSLGPAAQRWAPAYREGLAEITRLAGDLSSLNQKITNLPGESYVNIFWDPADGDPFGFAFEYGIGNAGSFSWTESYYWQL